VFENRVWRSIFKLNREEVAGGWRKLHKEKLHNLHSLPNIFTIMKFWRIRWAYHLAHMREVKNSYRFW
jgi:hypothetical protein